MSKLDAIIEAQQTAYLDTVECSDGRCPIRNSCFTMRLNISEKAIENGWRCAFEEMQRLWECYLPGVTRPMEVTEMNLEKEAINDKAHL